MLCSALRQRVTQGIAEWAPFAARLAIRLAGMAQAGQVRAGTPFWETAVDQLLLHAIDTDVKARARPLQR